MVTGDAGPSQGTLTGTGPAVGPLPSADSHPSRRTLRPATRMPAGQGTAKSKPERTYARVRITICCFSHLFVLAVP